MLENQVAVITGASRGIGRALAERLHAEGMRLAITARSAGDLDRLRDRLDETGRTVLSLPGDVTDPAHARAVIDRTVGELGPVDLLVNNAGLVEDGDQPLWACNVDAWWQAVTVNVRGAMLFAAAAVPNMLERRSGRVVSVNSIRSVRSMPTQTAYGASKAALAQMTESLQKSLVGTGVHAFSYSPGRVRTNMTDALGLAHLPPEAWTSMERAIEGMVTIAGGQLDALAGRFLHAGDDVPRLLADADRIVAEGGRTLTYADAHPTDHLRVRTVGR